jgi:hypothetical protein
VAWFNYFGGCYWIAFFPGAFQENIIKKIFRGGFMNKYISISLVLVLFLFFPLSSAHELFYEDDFICSEGECVFECPFEPAPGRIIVDLHSERLRADVSSGFKGSVFSVDIPAGDYKLTLVSYDGYENRSHIIPQENEEWFLALMRDEKTLILSGTISDIPDDVDFVGLVEVVNENLSIFKNIDSVQAVHAQSANKSSGPQSVETICAVFDLIEVNPYCEDVDDDRIVIDFYNARLLANKGLDSALKGPFYTHIEPGTYAVTLVSSDGYIGRNKVLQSYEEWFVVLNLSDMSGTGVVSDVPDYVNYASVIEVVDDKLVVDDFVDEVYILHAHIDRTGPESVNAQCAIFAPVDVPEPLCPIYPGDFCTQTQGGWGTACAGQNTGCLRDAYWDEVIGDNLTVGVGYTLTFTGSQYIEGFLPQGGPSDVLVQSHVNPSSSEANTFGGQVTALKLNVLFSDAGVGKSVPNLDVSIGELFLVSGKFEGLTVYELLDLAQRVLGGDLDLLDDYDASLSDLNDAVSSVNENFVDCLVDEGFLEWLTCEDEVFGSLTVCKQLHNESDVLVSGVDLNASFVLPVSGLPDAVFSTPLVYVDGLSCRLYENLELGTYDFGEEVISSYNESVYWYDPIYNLDYPYGSFDLYDNIDTSVVLSKSDPDKTVVVRNKYRIEHDEPPLPPEQLGSLTVCKQLYNESDVLVTGEGLNASFTLPLMNLNDAVFYTPLDYYNMSYAECVWYHNLSLGTYEFGNEIIVSDDEVIWDYPLYSLDGADFMLFDSLNGSFVLTEDEPDMIIVVRNKFYVNESDEPPVVPDDFGIIKVCKQLHNESGFLVTGDDLNVSFRLPISGLPDVVFNTPLAYLYKVDMDCKYIYDVPLGVYEFGEEIIISDDGLIWDEPLYSVNDGDTFWVYEYLNNGSFVLTAEDPDMTIIVRNKYVVHDESEPPLPPEQFGIMKVCKQLYNESNILVSDVDGLSASFTLPLLNLSDAVFNTSLSYDKGGLACVWYYNLSLGTYKFGEEIIWSDDELVVWDEPLYSLNNHDFVLYNYTNGYFVLTEDEPDMTIVVRNKYIFEDEPLEPLGSLKVCKQLYDLSNGLVSGDGLNATFTIPLMNLSDAVFNTPMVYDGELNCILYDDLPLGVYNFGEEIIVAPDNIMWNAPYYNLNYFNDSFDLYSDTAGFIELSEEAPHRKLVISNRFAINESEPVPPLPPELFGTLKVCKQIHNESDMLVSDVDGLNASFTLPLMNLSDAVFVTPLDYHDKADMECVWYHNLSLGTYEFGEEIILSDLGVVWDEPLYSLNNHDFVLYNYTSGYFVLTDVEPDMSIVIRNKYVVHDELVPPVIPDEFGILKVCKELHNESDFVVIGEGLNTTFILPFEGLEDVVFHTPLDYKFKVDMDCKYFFNVPLGEYRFGEEIIISYDDVVWHEPLYSVNNGDYFRLFEYLNNGSFVLTPDDPDMTIIVRNKYHVVHDESPVVPDPDPKPPVVPDPEIGSLSVCRQLFNESYDLVSGEGLGVEFILPLMNLSNARVSTPLVYEDGKHCILYENLSFGMYKFGEEIIDPHNYLISWDEPLYNLDYPEGSFEEFSDGWIELSSDSPDRIILIKNRFVLEEGYVGDDNGVGDVSVFDIELIDEWNLISVPFLLHDDSIDVVFNGQDGVVSVWTYEDDNWFVWSPDAPTSLDFMRPGWGYWVLTNKSSTLSVKGNLLSPGTVPFSRSLSNGWNLIGYYGSDEAPLKNDVPYFAGPNMVNGKHAGCALVTLVSDDDLPFPSILTYWGNDQNPWKPINANDEQALMNPGAGYWLFYSKDKGTYTLGTKC